MKKYVLYSLLLTIYSSMAFSQNGFEFGLNIPIGVGVGIANQKYRDTVTDEEKRNYSALKLNPGAGIDFGILFQAGYKITASSNMSVSILLDVGYKKDIYSFSVNGENNTLSKTSEYKASYFIFDNIQMGLYGKLNINKFSIGIGGGVKLPIHFSKSSHAWITYTTTNGGGYVDGNIYEGFGYSEIHYFFKYPVIGYLKITGDYSFYSAGPIALTVGGYASFNFPYELRINTLRWANPTYFEKYSIAEFNVGLQLGLKFNTTKKNKPNSNNIISMI